MMQWIKIAGLSAVLAAGVVTAFGDTGQAAPARAKVFHDRLPASSDVPEVRSEARLLPGAPASPSRDIAFGKGDRWSAQTAADCSAPYISTECLTPVGEARATRPVRTSTVEGREGTNTSVLVRVPQATFAAR